MKKHGLDTIMSDGSGVGHAPNIKKICAKHNIKLQPLARESETG